MGYPPPKDLKAWAGISSDEDTNPNIPLFNWDDVDLAKPVERKSKTRPPAFSVKIDISSYADKDPGPKLAQRKALDKFLEISKVDVKEVRYTTIAKQEEIILFSHIKKVYTIEITANKEAVKAYLINKKKRPGVK